MPLAILKAGSIILPPLPRWTGPRALCPWVELGLLVHRHAPACLIAAPTSSPSMGSEPYSLPATILP
jgi:hypothetical protein